MTPFIPSPAMQSGLDAAARRETAFTLSQAAGNAAYRASFDFYHDSQLAARAYHAAYNAKYESLTDRWLCGGAECAARRAATAVEVSPAYPILMDDPAFAARNADEDAAREAIRDEQDYFRRGW